MKKYLLFVAALMLSVCAQARIITPTGDQIWWGYFNESDFDISDNTVGTGSPMALMAGIYIPDNHEELGTAVVQGMRVYLPSDVVSSLSGMALWISKELPKTLKEADYVEMVSESLTANANDFLLKSPYKINNEGFYVGYYVKSSTGYFIRSAGDVIANSFWIGNPEAGMGWTDLSDGYALGKLAFQILVEGGNFPKFSAIAKDFKPAVVGLGQSVDVPISITNMGLETINELSYTITVNGETSEEQTISSLSIPYGITQEVIVPIESAAEEGTYSYTVTFTQVNGNENTARHNTASGNITTVETLKVWPRNVLIEEFTTEYCVYCPQAASGLAAFMKNYPDLAERVAVVCHHAGYYTDWLTVSASSTYTWFYNDGGATYAPAFMYDRYAWDGKTPVESRQSGAVGYKNRVEERLKKDSYANIELEAEMNEAKTKISVTANLERSWEFCDTPPRVTIFLTEDNITARSQSGASGTFTHQHVLRAVNQTWGVVPTWDDNKATVTYTFNLNSSWKLDDLKVIAFISGYDSANPTNCVVENAVVVAPSDPTSISIPTSDVDGKAVFYSIDGCKLSGAEQGINIIRMTDGTVKKVLVR